MNPALRFVCLSLWMSLAACSSSTLATFDDAGVPVEAGAPAVDVLPPSAQPDVTEAGGDSMVDDALGVQADLGIVQGLDGGSERVVDAASDVETGGSPESFATHVVSFQPGTNAGFGQDRLPDVVLGPPHGGGSGGGSLDVLSLGERGCIVLEFTAREVVDGEGPDLLVFENPFAQFFETGVVSVSEDGVSWATFACLANAPEHQYPGCAGTHYAYASPGNGLDPTDPRVAGGDPYDLHDVGLSRARFVRVCDSGGNSYAGISGGFDLDAVSIVHGQPR